MSLSELENESKLKITGRDHSPELPKIWSIHIFDVDRKLIHQIALELVTVGGEKCLFNKLWCRNKLKALLKIANHKEKMLLT